MAINFFYKSRLIADQNASKNEMAITLESCDRLSLALFGDHFLFFEFRA